MGRASLKLVASPERLALADAIKVVRERQAAVDALEDALSKVAQQIYAGFGAIEHAEAEVAKARDAAVTHLTETAMGLATETPKTLAQARAELQAVKDADVTARETREVLTRRLSEERGRLNTSERGRDTAITAVLQTDHTISALKSALLEAQDHAARLLAAMHAVFPGFTQPVPSRQNADAAAAEWKAAAARLKTDPDAPLPEVS